MLQDKPRDASVNAGVLARQTPGFSGAELSNLVNEAALLAAKTSKSKLSAELLDSARDKAIMGVERKSAATLLASSHAQRVKEQGTRQRAWRTQQTPLCHDVGCVLHALCFLPYSLTLCHDLCCVHITLLGGIHFALYFALYFALRFFPFISCCSLCAMLLPCATPQRCSVFQYLGVTAILCSTGFEKRPSFWLKPFCAQSTFTLP